MAADSGLLPEEIQRLCDLAKANPKVSALILYGSRAKGNFKPGSDIDLVIKGQHLTHRDLLDLDTAIDNLLLPYKTDLSLFHHIDNDELVEHIERVGKVLFCRASSSAGK